MPRLNIFALPTRTLLLFLLIVLVVALPILAALVDNTPLNGPGFVLTIVALLFWSFLRRPANEFQRHRLVVLSIQRPQLAAQIERLIDRAGLTRRPLVFLSDEQGVSPRTFGTFTQHYLVIPANRAAELENDLYSTDLRKQRGAEAIVLHELSHFANQDIVPTFLARSLLIVTIGYASVSMLATMLTPFLYNTLIHFYNLADLLPHDLLALLQASNPEMAQFLLHPPAISAAEWSRYETFVFSAYWPLILGGLFLLVFFWRALLRTRELYADARVAQWQGSAEIIQTELVREAARAALNSSALAALQPEIEDLRRWCMGLRHRVTTAQARVSGFIHSFTVLATHPKLETRRACLTRPELIYGSAVTIGITAGLTVVMLNLTMDSLFLSRFLRGPNATLPFVLGFLVLSLSYLPRVCLTNGWLDLQRQFTRSTLIFTGIKLVPQYLAGFMIALVVMINPRIIDEVGFTLVGGGGATVPSLGISLDFVIEVYVIRPAFLFTLVMPLTLLAFLWLDTRLKRTVLTWYGAPYLQRHPVALLWGVTGWLALILWFMVLPFYNVATEPTAHSLLDPFAWVPLCLMGLMSVFVIGWLVVQHRRYARRCSRCAATIAGEYQPGNCCSHCGQKLHAWLTLEDSALNGR